MCTKSLDFSVVLSLKKKDFQKRRFHLVFLQRKCCQKCVPTKAAICVYIILHAGTRKGSPVLSACPPLGLVSPHLELSISISGDFTSYLYYRGEGCHLIISVRGQKSGESFYLLCLQTFSQIPPFWAPASSLLAGISFAFHFWAFLASSRVDQLASCYRHSGWTFLISTKSFPFLPTHLLSNFMHCVVGDATNDFQFHGR